MAWSKCLLALGMAILVGVSACRSGERCPVHSVALVYGLVPIEYGKGAELERYHDGRRGYPNAHTYVPGGCMVRDETMEWTKYCPACREMKRGIEGAGRRRTSR